MLAWLFCQSRDSTWVSGARVLISTTEPQKGVEPNSQTKQRNKGSDQLKYTAQNEAHVKAMVLITRGTN